MITFVLGVLVGLGGYWVACHRELLPGACASTDSDDTMPSNESVVSQYKSLTDHMAASIMLHDQGGEIAWCSPYTEVLTGFSRTEVMADRNKFLMDNVFEEDQDDFRRAFAIVTSGEPYQYRYRFRHKSGVLLWLETRAVPVFNPSTGSHMCLTITIDITASVHDQIKLEERNRDLNDFTYMVSHDLKAPILTLQGMLELLEEQAQSPEKAEIDLTIGHMRRAVSRLQSLVGGILELAQISISERQNEGVSLDEVLSDVQADWQMELKNVGGVLEVASPLPVVFGNKKFLYHIFANLLGNSIKYRHHDRALKIIVHSEYLPSRKRFRISFRDNGQGISEEFHKEIFKPFVRIEGGNQDGCGVGLATVYRLVEKLSGRISIQNSEPGAEFNIELRRPL